MALPAELVGAEGACFAEGVYGAEEVALLAGLPEDSLPVMQVPASRVRHLRRDGVGLAHRRMYYLGLGSGRIRRGMRMRGSLFARVPVIAPLLAPARLVLTGLRSARCGWPALADFLRLSPLVACLMAAYAVGFAAGAMGAEVPANPWETPEA
jgi:hypothetical protein